MNFLSIDFLKKWDKIYTLYTVKYTDVRHSVMILTDVYTHVLMIAMKIQNIFFTPKCSLMPLFKNTHAHRNNCFDFYHQFCLFLSLVQMEAYIVNRLHYWVSCFFLSTYCFEDLFLLLYASVLCSLVLLSIISLYEGTMNCLPYLLLKDIWIVSSLMLIWIILPEILL